MRLAVGGLALALLANAAALAQRRRIGANRAHSAGSPQDLLGQRPQGVGDYLQEMAYWYAGLALNITPHVADYQKNLFLKYAAPSRVRPSAGRVRRPQRLPPQAQRLDPVFCPDRAARRVGHEGRARRGSS
jgi:hypothetical protein